MRIFCNSNSGNLEVSKNQGDDGNQQLKLKRKISKPISRFSNPDHSLNRKRERFKVFEVEPGSNRDDVIINLIIN